MPDPDPRAERPAARAAGEAMAAEHFELDAGRVREAVDPVTIAALAIMALELMAACIAERRKRNQPPPTGIGFKVLAAELIHARWWWMPDWPKVRARRALEAVAGRRALPRLRAAGLRLSRAKAVELALRRASAAEPIDLALLAKEAEADNDDDDGGDGYEDGPGPGRLMPAWSILFWVLVLPGLAASPGCGTPVGGQELHLKPLPAADSPASAPIAGAGGLVEAAMTGFPGAAVTVRPMPGGAGLVLVVRFIEGGDTGGGAGPDPEPDAGPNVEAIAAARRAVAGLDGARRAAFAREAAGALRRAIGALGDAVAVGTLVEAVLRDLADRLAEDRDRALSLAPALGEHGPLAGLRPADRARALAEALETVAALAAPTASPQALEEAPRS